MRRSAWPFWLLLVAAALSIPASAQLFNLARYGTVRAFESPFNGTVCAAGPATFTTQINAVNYDCGGQGIAFSHTYNNSSCTAGQSYRPDFVNFNAITDSGASFDLGCVILNDFYRYTTNVTGAGPFLLNMRVGEGSSGARWGVNIDGTQVTTLTVTPTGGYQVFQTQPTGSFNAALGNHVMQIQCIALDANGFCGDLVFTQGAIAGGSCVNSGVILCSLLGSAGPDLGAENWMGRFWDFSDGLIGQNQCPLNYPIDGGADFPGIISSYQVAVSNNSGCFSSVYGYKLQNEWNEGCPATNPWFVSTGNCLSESQAPVVSFAQYKQNVCTMANYIRSMIPGARIEWYGPHNDVEAQFDPSDTCQIDTYGLHIYLYGNCTTTSNPTCAQLGRSGAGDWLGGTPYSCAPPGGITKTLPNDITCAPTSREAYLAAYANNPAHRKPMSISEWCSAYGDTNSPNGDDYGTWVIANWIKANNVAISQHWSGSPNGGNQSDCSVSNNSLVSSANLESAMNHAFGGTSFGGNSVYPLSTYKTLPVPNPYR